MDNIKNKLENRTILSRGERILKLKEEIFGESIKKRKKKKKRKKEKGVGS